MGIWVPLGDAEQASELSYPVGQDLGTCVLLMLFICGSQLLLGVRHKSSNSFHPETGPGTEKVVFCGWIFNSIFCDNSGYHNCAPHPVMLPFLYCLPPALKHNLSAGGMARNTVPQDPAQVFHR